MGDIEERIPGDNQKENNNQLIEIAAEQLANLLWKHLKFRIESGKPKSKPHQLIETSKNLY